MKTLIILAAAALTLSLEAIRVLNAGDVVIVSGTEFDYHIPQQFKKAHGSIFGSKKIEGDSTGSSVLLLLSGQHLPDVGLKRPWEANMILFWDRDYGADGGIVSTTKRLVEDAEPAGRSGAYWKYLAPLGTLQRTYYISFDPKQPSVQASDDLYYVKTLVDEAVEISSIKREPNVTCSLHSIHDGINIGFGTGGAHCGIEQFASLHTAVSKLLQSWRKKREE